MKAVKNNIDKSGCISEKMLLDYAHGTLSPADQHYVERHLIDCNLCTEALEGLLLIRNSDKAIEMVAALKHDINKRIIKDRKLKPIAFHWWQIAAILVIIIMSSGSYFIIHRASKEAENTIANNESLNNKNPEKENTEVHEQAAAKEILIVKQVDKSNGKIKSNPKIQYPKKASDEPIPGQQMITEESATTAKEVTDESDRQKAHVTLQKGNEPSVVSDAVASKTEINKDVRALAETQLMNINKNTKSVSKLPSANQNAIYDKTLKKG